MRPVASVAALCVLGLSACGADEERTQKADPFKAVEARSKADEEAARGRAAPRWVTTRTLDVEGTAKRRIRIADDAVQWRVRWTCDGSTFAVSADDTEIGRGKCPGKGKAEGRGRSQIVLSVATKGRWRMTVEQQVTTPIDEAPLPSLSAKRTRVVKRGRFKPIERRGAGTAVVHRLASGRLVLRLSGFSTAANTDLEVWLSPVPAPRTTTAVLEEPHRKVANLKATIGAQNYVLPADVKLADVRSIVIWCEPVRIAYTAATLKR